MSRLTADECEAHARHNEDFLDHLIGNVLGGLSKFTDWGFVVVFYSALHYTKAHIVRKHGEWAESHGGHYGADGAWVEGHNELVGRRLPMIKFEYEDLFDLSIQARYGVMHSEGGSLFPELKRKRVYLNSIKSAIGAAS